MIPRGNWIFFFESVIVEKHELKLLIFFVGFCQGSQGRIQGRGFGGEIPPLPILPKNFNFQWFLRKKILNPP